MTSPGTNEIDEALNQAALETDFEYRPPPILCEPSCRLFRDALSRRGFSIVRTDETFEAGLRRAINIIETYSKFGSNKALFDDIIDTFQTDIDDHTAGRAALAQETKR